MSERTPLISRGLDYYKATMGQVEHEKLPDTEVTFALKNRTPDRKLSEFIQVDELQAALDSYQKGWQPEEIAYLAGLANQDGKAQFSQEYLDYLADNPIPPITVSLDEENEIAVETTGPAALVTFWETIVMSEINERYFANMLAQQGTSLEEVYAEGDRRLSEKIARLKERPDIKISDFGTRRRFSYEWHHHVVTRLAKELPESFVGTSNIALANELDVKPIGTFAHELPMIYAAKADIANGHPLEGHNKMLQDWQEVNRGDLSTALTDTFTSEYFFHDFTSEQAHEWNGLRHDSGDPVEFGERAIAFYQEQGIDPMSKTIVFSDGLNIDSIIELADHFAGKINVTFGWGTALTNDLGLKPLNIVMKAVEVEGTKTVKLSDDEGKHTGTPEKITHYKQEVANEIGACACNTMEVITC